MTNFEELQLSNLGRIGTYRIQGIAELDAYSDKGMRAAVRLFLLYAVRHGIELGNWRPVDDDNGLSCDCDLIVDARAPETFYTYDCTTADVLFNRWRPDMPCLHHSAVCLYQWLKAYPRKNLEAEYRNTVRKLLGLGGFLNSDDETFYTNDQLRLISTLAMTLGCRGILQLNSGAGLLGCYAGHGQKPDAQGLPGQLKYRGLTGDDRTILMSEVLFDAYQLKPEQASVAPVNLDSWTDVLMAIDDSGCDCVVLNAGMVQDGKQLLGRQLRAVCHTDNVCYAMFMTTAERLSGDVAGDHFYKQFYGQLVEDNQLHAVIELPIMNQKAEERQSLVVLKLCRQADERITLIDFDLMHPNARVNFVGSIIGAWHHAESTARVDLSRQDIQAMDYALRPMFYNWRNRTTAEGKKVYPLDQLLHALDSQTLKAKPLGMPVSKVTPDMLEDDAGLVLRNKDTAHLTKAPVRGCYAHQGSMLVALEDKHGVSFYLHDGRKSAIHAALSRLPAKVYSINTQVVRPDYLVLAVMSQLDSKLKFRTLTGMMHQSVVIDTSLQEQKRRVEQFKEDYVSPLLETQRDAVADLVHLMGTSSTKINMALAELKYFLPDNQDYQRQLQIVKDNFDFIFRMAKNSNNLFQNETFDRQPLDIRQFLDSYLPAWEHCLGGAFETETAFNVPESTQVLVDKDKLIVQMDAIMDNARRHSFNKTYAEGNRMRIGLSAVTYAGQPFVLLSVANNGAPLAEGFTLDDYCSRERFTGQSGRSGLGGYHAYLVAKKNEGYLGLRRDKAAGWHFIVDVLLPLATSTWPDGAEPYTNQNMK